MIEEEAERWRSREPVAYGSRDFRDRGGFEPFLKNLAEVDCASHTLTIGMSPAVLNPATRTYRTLGPEDPLCAGRFLCWLSY